MAICLPGMASRVNRAATSATRPAPLVMTTNWMTTRIRKIDQPDDQRAADDEVAEGLDHLAGVAVQQDEAGRADVERQPEQRGDQQQRREDGEVERARDVQADQQDEDGDGDVDGDEQVEHDRRQRDDHHHDDADDRCGDADLTDPAGLHGTSSTRTWAVHGGVPPSVGSPSSSAEPGPGAEPCGKPSSRGGSRSRQASAAVEEGAVGASASERQRLTGRGASVSERQRVTGIRQ